ncbi:MAG: methionyl-tRNA formyltransferase [Synergistaceae bacterium]|nr:methionyl-tRNA formyltransferase [Synergistaceae bacterium]
MDGKCIWFMGTGQFAALCLEGLTKNGVTLSRIITGLPTRSGRNGKENPSDVERKAAEMGIGVSRTGKLSENQELIDALEAEQPAVIFVIDFGQIIREPFLSRMCLNIHPSLLPEYRGAAPIQRALLDGREYTGVTVFRLVQAMDAGGIAAQRRVEANASDNASDLYRRLSEIGCELAAEAVSNIDALTFTPQDDSRATFAPKLEKADFALTFGMTAREFVNRVRALDMSGGAYVMINGKRVKVWRASVRDDLKGEVPGQVLEVKGCLAVACGDFCIELSEVQNEGKARISGIDWARGMRIRAGDNLCKV